VIPRRHPRHRRRVHVDTHNATVYLDGTAENVEHKAGIERFAWKSVESVVNKLLVHNEP